MAACLCTTIQQLAQHPDEIRASELAASLDAHLRDVRAVLVQSKALSRSLQYRITPVNERTNKAFFVNKLDLTSVNNIYERYGEDVEGFWASEDTEVALCDLRRRIACVVVFLRSTVDPQAPVPPSIVNIFKAQFNYAEIRNAGRKYIKISRRLGGLGSIFELPLNIPHSTYERYLQLDDDEVFQHFQSIGLNGNLYTSFVQRIIMYQFQHESAPLLYYNLILDHAEVLNPSDLLLLLLYGLGSTAIPSIVWKNARLPQRRWNSTGEIEHTNALDFGLLPEILNLLRDDETLGTALDSPNIIKDTTEDDMVLWSIAPGMIASLDSILTPAAAEHLGEIAMRLVCFICPPCLEGNLDWSIPLKDLVWQVFERTVTKRKVPVSMRSQIVNASLYFAERDSVPIRQASVALARTLLRKSMSYHLHASVVLFQSTMSRIEGDFVKSESQLRDFARKGPKPVTRRDHGLLGRLHISHVETKIKLGDKNVAMCVYDWKAEEPKSSLDVEVTFRLQSTAARYFQSVGDFPAAKASLNQLLSLDCAKPIRSNTRRLLVGRLADVCSEMQEYDKALDLLEAEINRSATSDRSRRWFLRLLLAGVEANIGLGRFDDASSILEELASREPEHFNDIHDEQLHIRRLTAAARLVHMRAAPEEAVARWQEVLREFERMHTLTVFVAAMINLFLAHAYLLAGERDGGRRAWAAGLDILRTEKCEYWLPTVSTLWLRWIVEEVHRLQGWSFEMMQPGGKPDIVWPSTCPGSQGHM